MGEIYSRFKALRENAADEWFLDEIGLVTFERCGKNYEIYFTRKRANKYSNIYCEDNTIEWEQFPALPHVLGKMYGKRHPIISLSPMKNSVKIVVITGKPNSIYGLDEGIFRSVHTYDENYINVMPESYLEWL